MLDKHLWRDFAAVTASVAVLGIGVGSTYPLCALVLTGEGFGADVVGWTVAASAAGGIAGTIACPAATLRFGRRRVMLGCVAAAAASVVSLQSVHALWAWMLLRALFGAAMAPMFVLGEAWINALPGDAVRGRIVAIYTTSFTVCQVLGPEMTNFLARVPRHSFALCGAVFLLGMPGIALARNTVAAAPERIAAAARAAKDTDASWLDILWSAPAIVAGAALFAAFDAIMLSFLPLYALDHGFDRTQALAAVVIVFAGDAALQFAAGWLADRFGIARVQRLAGLGVCAMLPLLPFAGRHPGFWQAYLFVLGGLAGSLYTLAMVSSGERFGGAALVRASGLIALTWCAAMSVGPAATGLIMQRYGSASVTSVLWLISIAFVAASFKREIPFAADVP